MTDHRAKLESLGLRLPEVLLPAAGTDYGKWAVVACDQYSSEREYWKRAEGLVAGAPSTLGLIFPEAYLEDADADGRIARIQATMRDYLARGVLASVGEGLVLVERFTPFEKKPRVGLVLAVDLEAYRYGADSTSLIRPSEGTIVERLPPRMRIRRGAPLELPHIMLLLDDPKRSVIEPVHAARKDLPTLYDFELMLGSGRIRGWKVADPAVLDAMLPFLRERYGNTESAHARGQAAAHRVPVPVHVQGAAVGVQAESQARVVLLVPGTVAAQHADLVVRADGTGGPQGIRVLQGFLQLAAKHTPANMEAASQLAATHGGWHLRELKVLLAKPSGQDQFQFIQQHPLIRDLSHYQALVPDCFSPPSENQ